MMTFMGSILTNHDRSQMLDKCCLSISELKTQIMITIFIVLNIIFCTTLVYYQEDPDMCPCVYDQDDLMEVIMKCDLTTDTLEPLLRGVKTMSRTISVRKKTTTMIL